MYTLEDVYFATSKMQIVVNNIASDFFSIIFWCASRLSACQLYLGHINNKYEFNYHFYADDVQIYFTFNADRATSNVFKIV